MFLNPDEKPMTAFSKLAIRDFVPASRRKRLSRE